MQLRLAHGSLEAEKQPIVEMARVVDPVFVQDQRVGECADLQQPMPVGRATRQARNLQSQHDSGMAQSDLGHQLLEAGPVHGRGARLAQVAIDHDDLVGRPPQGNRPLAQGVLVSGGETFLASLALAQALAERLPELGGSDSRAMLESLFLDEGFGMLDEDALDTVATAIESLRSHKRMVCIITHLPQLAARMPARIDVIKSEGGSRALVRE